MNELIEHVRDMYKSTYPNIILRLTERLEKVENELVLTQRELNVSRLANESLREKLKRSQQ